MLGQAVLLALLSQSATATEGSAVESLPTYDYVVYSLVAVFLITFGGLMSGLNVGMLSLDELELEQKIATGTPAERKQASKILRVIDKHHWLLVSILLGNAACSETLPLILGFMFNEVISIVISVTFVLFCGEIIPQAFMTGPDQLKIAGRLVIFVRILMIVMAPISFPLSLLLDRFLGHTPRGVFSIDDLSSRVRLHRSHSQTEGPNGRATVLDPGQLNIIIGALQLKGKFVREYMTQINLVYSVCDTATLDANLMRQMRKLGHSRVPIYSGSQKERIYGYILIKQFIGRRLATPKPLRDSDIEVMRPIITTPDTDMLTLMYQFKESNCHIAIVVDPLRRLDKREFSGLEGDHTEPCLGIITLEAVFELILQVDILDEKDVSQSTRSSMLSGIVRKSQHPNPVKAPSPTAINF